MAKRGLRATTVAGVYQFNTNDIGASMSASRSLSTIAINCCFHLFACFPSLNPLILLHQSLTLYMRSEPLTSHTGHTEIVKAWSPTWPASMNISALLPPRPSGLRIACRSPCVASARSAACTGKNVDVQTAVRDIPSRRPRRYCTRLKAPALSSMRTIRRHFGYSRAG